MAPAQNSSGQPSLLHDTTPTLGAAEAFLRPTSLPPLPWQCDPENSPINPVTVGLTGMPSGLYPSSAPSLRQRVVPCPHGHTQGCSSQHFFVKIINQPRDPSRLYKMSNISTAQTLLQVCTELPENSQSYVEGGKRGPTMRPFRSKQNHLIDVLWDSSWLYL